MALNVLSWRACGGDLRSDVVLGAFSKRWPDEEFRGHNVMNCECHGVLGACTSFGDWEANTFS